MKKPALHSHLLLFLFVLSACGQALTPHQEDGEGSDAQEVSSPPGSFGGGPAAATETGSAKGTDLEKCATSSARAKASRLYLVFMFDRSGSMALGDRWASCRSATESFFGANESAGISASLHYFPIMGLIFPNCDVSKYAKPAVPMTTLPNGAFAQSLAREEPAGSTPTGPALAGAIRYAQDIARGQAKDGGKVAVVLVSDGAPEGCGDDLTTVSKIASNVAQTIPTYVIGVGEVGNLNAIATAGGTKQAFIVSSNDPTQLQSDFQKAMADVRSSALACDYAIPAAPSGEKLDRNKVNVLQQTGAAKSPIPHNAECKAGQGWRYDNPDNPSRIIICEETCTTLRADPTASIDVVFGCETRTGDVK
jgi:hypothetical protein